MRARHVWIIERKDGDKWRPTNHNRQTRKAARRMLRVFCERIHSRFRIRKYVPAPTDEEK